MKILLVDDDRQSRNSVGWFLREMGHEVVESENGEEALEKYIANNGFTMVLSDLKMPRMSGTELLAEITKIDCAQETDFILFTGHGDMKTAIKALKLGAYDYLIKPVNVDELALLTSRIEKQHKLKQEYKELKVTTKVNEQKLSQLKKTVATSVGLNNIGVFSAKMQRIVELAKKYHTDRSMPVLIHGETGTGKELVARLIHFGDFEEAIPFIDINCAAITPSLFESELFGYEAGSFTGGLAKGQKGKFDIAQGGTLFLDEVAEIPLELQGKLLRVIQEKEFYRVGGLSKVKTNVRIICATNADIDLRVNEGKFREDLYYRLKVGKINIPPLRERKEAIRPLAEMFLKNYSKAKGKHFKRIGREAAEILLNHHWSGNVRELQNSIEWAAFMYDDFELKPVHLDFLSKESQNFAKTTASHCNKIDVSNFSLPAEGFLLDDFVNNIIVKAIDMHNGIKSEAARYLGITRRSLYSRLNHINQQNKR